MWRLARAIDDRPVVAEREAKSVSVEDTFEHDITDRALLTSEVDRMSRTVADRLRRNGLSGRTVTLKVRHHDFETHTRSSTLRGPTDSSRVLTETARALLDGVDLAGGLRLLGVGVSGLADWVQDDLFTEPRRRRRADDARTRALRPRHRDGALVPRAGRPPRRARRRLGVGCRARPRHGALRDPAALPRARCTRSPRTTPR